ncbi:MAG: alpha/beta hydrolase [Sneathiella sp.]|nr:alpha/beta hydrolase [Sneathiella sp.]
MSWQSYLANFIVRRRFKSKSPEGTSVEQARFGLDSISARKFKKPKRLSISSVAEPGVPGEWLRFAGCEEGKVCLYFHGGGYFWGTPEKYRSLTARLAKEFGGPVFVPDYSLAPEAPYPAAVDDALKAYQYILETGVPSGKIAIAGDSAGGGLALALVLAIKREGLLLPGVVTLISPWTDLTCSGESMSFNSRKDPLFQPSMLMWNSRYYVGDNDKSNPYISPLFGDLTGLPPILFQVGSTEVLLDDSRRAHQKISEQGGSSKLDIWPKVMHVWHLAADFIPEGRRAIKQMASFMNIHIN